MRSKQCQGCEYMNRDCKDRINSWYGDKRIIWQWTKYRIWCELGPIPIVLVKRCKLANGGKGGVHIAP